MAPQGKITDETYVIDLCDQVLNLKAKRQHRFDFLRGDSGARLPVDAYYEDLNLVIEYRERQHSEPVTFFDRRMTCSGCNRAEQRKRYDDLRQQVLPQHSINLIALDFSLFQHNIHRRLKRDIVSDERVIRKKLSGFIPIPR